VGYKLLRKRLSYCDLPLNPGILLRTEGNVARLLNTVDTAKIAGGAVDSAVGHKLIRGMRIRMLFWRC